MTASDDELYGTSPAMRALAAEKAFNALPLGSKERRDALYAQWAEIVAEEAADLE